MSKLRRKFIAVLAVLFCALLCVSTALFIPKPKTASAARGSNFDIIGLDNDDLYLGNGNFNANHLTTLYKKITGNSGANFNTVKTLISTKGGAVTSADIRENNSGNNISVWLGGIKWDVVYLTTKRNSTDIIVDLWQSADNVKYTGRTFSDHAVDDFGNINNISYPSSMYSTSRIRIIALNKGGYYSTGRNTLSSKQFQQADNFYARFTMSDALGSLVSYIVTPADVAYQETESAQDNATSGSPNANDAYGEPTDSVWSGDMNFAGKGSAANGTAYDDWKNDYVWLPSIAETGNIDADNQNGIWKTDASLRSTTTPTNVWLRSSRTSNSSGNRTLTRDGGYENTDANYTGSVRPAIHLNLTEVMRLAAADITTTYTGSELTIPGIYTSNPDEVSWYIPAAFDNNLDYVYKLNDSESQVLNTGTYKATMTFKSDPDLGFIWRAPDANTNNKSKTINITVNKKKVKVKFTSQSAVTTGSFDNYPKVDYETGQIATSDLPNGKNYATNYPVLRIKYENLTSHETSYNQPVIPGTYRAYAEIDEKKVTNLNYEIITEDGSYHNYVDFTVNAIEVTNPTLLNSGALTYNGSVQTVNIGNTGGLTDSLIQYTVKKDGSEISSGNKDTSFEIIDAGNYTVIFSFVSDEIKNTHVWKDSGKNGDYELKFEVKKKQLTVTLDGSDDFKKGSWGAKTLVRFTVNLDGICERGNPPEKEKVQLYVYYTKDGNGKTGAGDEGNYTYVIPDNLEKGTGYKLFCELTTDTVNSNYELNYEGKTYVEKSFEITTAKASFDESYLKWSYANDLEGSKDIASGGHVTFNENWFTISLVSTYDDLKVYGLMVDKDNYGNNDGLDGDLKKFNANAHPDEAAVYTITVRIVALNEDYEFTPIVVEFKWYIDQADYDLNSFNIQWGYKARGKTYENYDPDKGAEYEGGSDAGNNGYIEMYISGGLPDGLTVSLSENRKYAVDTYTLTVTGFANTNPNYNPVASFDDLTWKTYSWKIVPRTLSTAADKWVAADYENEHVTVGPKLDILPYNSNVLDYKYYETRDCSDEIAFEDLKYTEGTEKTYYVLVYIIDSETGNWILGTQNNPYEFVIGAAKTAVEITITAGGKYDGTAKPATVEINGTVDGIDLGCFDIVYYKEGSDTPCGVPKDAGSYRVVVSLKEEYTEKYYIKGTKSLEFEITKRILDVPPTSVTVTYDGTEQDVAALVEFPEGWENYIEISIVALNGVNPSGNTVKTMGTYTATFAIKEGINGGGIVNVEWNANAKTSNKMATIKVIQLVLTAKGWNEDGYYSTIDFEEIEESDADKFVEYKVYDVDGNEVDFGKVYSTKGEMFTVRVSVKEEHGDNVIIDFAKNNVADYYEFWTDGGEDPVQIDLPTIADLIFNGKSQTFDVDYGGFEDYIEIDSSLSDMLSQLNVGEYTVYFKIKSGKNAVWTTGGRGATPVTFEMKPLVLEDPKVDENQKFTYTGNEITAILNIDAAILAQFLDVDGDYTAINAGEYHFTLSIKESFAGNVVWKSVTGEKSVDWTIEKAKITVKWTDGDIPELDLPEEFKDLDVEYEIKDENGNVVTRDQMEAGGKYTITAKLADGSEANYEFVDDSGKPLATPTKTDGMSFQYKSAASSFPWWILAVIGAALLLLALLIIIIVKRRQVADGEDEYDDYYDDEYDFDEEEIEEEYEDDGGDFGDDF